MKRNRLISNFLNLNMKLTPENNLSINDFITNKSNIDGLIVSSKNDLDYIKILIDLRNLARKDYENLNSFLSNATEDGIFCFVNMDSQLTISEDDSLKLFQKTRTKLKVIFYNELGESLHFEDLFKFINWMRLIKIGHVEYFNLPENTSVLLQARGNAKKRSKQSIFFNSDAAETIDVFSCFYFPLTTTSFEASFLEAINSEKNINTHYTEVTDLKITRVDRISDKGYSLGEIDLNSF